MLIKPLGLFHAVTVRLQVALIIISLFFLCSCGSIKTLNKKPSDTSLKIVNTTLSKAVEKKDNLNVPLEPGSLYTTEDKEIVSNIYFTDLTGAHLLRWEWYDPNNTLYYSTEDHELKASPGTFVQEGTASHKLFVNGTKASDLPGTWKVKIFLDDALIAVNDFSIGSKVSKPFFNDTDKIQFGTYQALIIGNNNYQTLQKLQSPHKDASAMANLLTKKYNFTVNLKFDATRADIIEELDALRRKLTAQDNLLIFYSGHSWLDHGTQESYWLPVDATEDNTLNWIPSSKITASIKALQAKHVLIIADSCYSGILTREIKNDLMVPRTNKYYNQMAQKKTRSILMSGGLKPVLDRSGKTEYSEFAKALMQTLNSNRKIIDGTELFSNLSRSVMLNTDQTPTYSDIRKAGHDGGDFLFVCDH